MVDAQIIGLETDAAVKAYLSSRKIPSIPFPIHEMSTPKEVYPSEKKVECISLEDLYSLFEVPPLDGGAFSNMPVFVHGSSRYHHICHGLLKKVIDPNLDSYIEGEDERNYTLFLIDNHEDTCSRKEESSGSSKKLVHCGTHIADSVMMKDSYCRTAQYIHFQDRNGMKIKSASALKRRDEVDLAQLYFENMFFRRAETEEEMNKRVDEWYDSAQLANLPDLAELMVHFMLPNVYVTIDIDALSPDIVDINSFEDYDQGKMPLEDMLAALEITLRKRNVVGIDINGMTPDPRCQGVYDSILKTIRETERV